MTKVLEGNIHVEISFLVTRLETAFLEDEKSTTLRVWSSGNSFCRNYQVTKEDHAEADNLFKGEEQVIVALLRVFIEVPIIIPFSSEI